MNIRFTLIAEGTSDLALLPIIQGLIRADSRVGETEAFFANETRLPQPRAGLAARIRCALDRYPAEILIVHRDADREAWADRREEIMKALSEVASSTVAVPIVPVRMTEAWLLTDENAIRRASGSPRGTVPLELPRPRAIENCPDPKQLLRAVLRRAADLPASGRRAQKFDDAAAVQRIAEFMEDYTPLRQLSAFVEFERELKQVLNRLATNRA